jgi:hypothetical protein
MDISSTHSNWEGAGGGYPYTSQPIFSHPAGTFTGRNFLSHLIRRARTSMGEFAAAKTPYGFHPNQIFV